MSILPVEHLYQHKKRRAAGAAVSQIPLLSVDARMRGRCQPQVYACSKCSISEGARAAPLTRTSIVTDRTADARRALLPGLALWVVLASLPLRALGADSGDSTERTVKVGGFFDALGAYTYAEPEHWSRGVGRLQLNASGKMSDSVDWKLGGRADIDIVYLSSDFYPDRVKQDQRARFFHGENFVHVSAGDWDVRVGSQQIVWGEVIGLFFADVVSARDLREFLLPSFDIIRIPQWAARAEYTSGDSHLELVFIPIPVFDEIGKPGSDFFPARLPSPLPDNVSALFRDPIKPSHGLEHSNYGIRANTLVGGWDIAGFYYRSMSASPTFYRVATGDPAQPVVFEPRYDRIWQAGGTLSQAFDQFVLRGEAVYAHGQGYAVTDPAVADGVVKRNTLDAIVSLDFPLPRDTRLNVQAFTRKFFGGGVGDIAVKSDGFGASVFISTKLSSAWEPQLLWIQSFHDGGGLVRPRINWYPARNYSLGFGFDIFTGPDDGFFGRYNNRDRAYAELRYDF